MRSESKRRWEPSPLPFPLSFSPMVEGYSGGLCVCGAGAPSTDLDYLYDRFECEHACWDPKDGELCLNRVKPEETLVEARSDTDVQIVRQIWV